jgi:signal transduction histidine kinase
VPRRIPIRIKLAAALAVPILALLAVATLEVAQSWRNRTDLRDQTELARASAGPGGIVTALQNERNYGSVWLLGSENLLTLPVTSFDQAMTETDAAIATFRDDIEARGGDVAATFGPALEEVEPRVDELRTLVIDYNGPRTQDNQEVSEPFFNGYTEVIDGLLQATSQVPVSIDDPILRRGVELGEMATLQIENMARLSRVFLLAGVSDGLNDAEEIADAAALLGQVESTNAEIRDLGVGPYAEATDKVFADLDASNAMALANQFVENGQVDIGAWLPTLSREDDEGFNGYRDRVYAQVDNRADELTSDADQRMILYGVLALAALLIAAMVTWLVSRSITRPLRSLTRQATDMAESRLPEAVTDILETPLGEDVVVPTVEPIRVSTRDEVSDVADALNTVQDSALELAVEQAVLRRNIADSFVNLGRRNQNLLGRQLDFITELESRETDADTLANLFRLDHLATRMRRNAESLLVLAGIEPPRQWAAPVRLTDVIRAALSEVEDYQRVTVRGVEPATIVGSAAADLAHLLAELIENALVFSPPDQSVDIRGRSRPDGYTLAIIDSGLGMPAGDVAAANRRLAGAESFTIAPSKYLGHYVAGNLAARHDIEVTLDNSPGNGITATVSLPVSLLTVEDELQAPAPDASVGSTHASPFGAMPPLNAGPTGAAPAVAPPGAGTTGERPALPARATGEIPPAPVVGPAPADPVQPAPGPATVFPPAATEPPGRTPSGLVKRSRRADEEAPLAVMPEGDLLASLSSVTSNLGSASPAARTTAPSGGVSPTNPWTSAGRSAGRSWAAPGGRAPDDRGSDLAPSPDRPALPGRTTAPTAPAPSPERPPLVARGGGPGNGNGSGDRGPGTGDSGPGTGDGGQTVGGLTRRVRGAQLPTTQPLNLRRREELPPRPSTDYRQGAQHDAYGHELGNGQTDGHTNGRADDRRGVATPAGAGGQTSSAADNVYGFLTSFTQGVQRGLDESRSDPNGPKENQ